MSFDFQRFSQQKCSLKLVHLKYIGFCSFPKLALIHFCSKIFDFFLHSDPVHSSAEVSDSRHSLRRRQDDNDQGTNYLTRIPLSQFFRLTANSAQTGASSQIYFQIIPIKYFWGIRAVKIVNTRQIRHCSRSGLV